MEKCFTVKVLKSVGSDCTNNGSSNKYNTLYILHPKGWETLPKGTPISQQCLFFEDICCGEPRKRIVPLQCWNSTTGYIRSMFGGNFAYCSDSRSFGIDGICGGQPVHIHDRIEA